MSSVSESGHAKNLAYFETLIIFCIGYGAKYNPSKANLKLASLNALCTNAHLVLDTLKDAMAEYARSTNDREVSFIPLKKLVTKIVSALRACGAMDQTIDDAKTIVKKIQGRRSGSTKKEEPITTVSPEETPKTVSTSQQSYDMLTDHFAKLIKTVSSAPEYSPNEEELKISTLNALLTDLRAKNTGVANANTRISNMRIARNKIMYAPGTGIHDVSQGVKNYVKSLYGTTSQEYKQVSSMKFVNFMDK